MNASNQQTHRILLPLRGIRNGGLWRSSLGAAIANVLPFLIIMALVVFLVRKSVNRNKPYMDRAMLNMDRLEKQNEEIIALLKAIAGKGRTPEQSPSVLPAPVRHSEEG